MGLSSDQVKEFAYSLGMDLCGIGSVDRFASSPRGKHPCDLLPGCKSVIVVGLKLLEGVINAQFRSFEDHNPHAAGVYGTYGYSVAPNFHLLTANYQLARFIESKTGETTTPVPSGPFGNSMPLSVRHAAVACGLGEFGWLGIVITPQFGPRNRFSVLLSQAALEPDPMYSGPRLCDPVKCQICTNICPTHAISRFGEEEPKKVNLGDKHYEYCQINWNRCRVAAHGLRREFGGDKDYITTPDPSAADIDKAFLEMGIDNANLQHYPTYKCGRCLAYCPVGGWKEKYGNKGLSRFDPDRAMEKKHE